MSKVIKIPLEDGLIQQLDDLAAMLGQPKARLIKQAIRDYVAEQAWQIRVIREAVDEYERGESVLVPHEEVMARLAAIVYPRPA